MTTKYRITEGPSGFWLIGDDILETRNGPFESKEEAAGFATNGERLISNVEEQHGDSIITVKQ